MAASSPQVAAFFDIDGTILSINSAASFARYMWEIGVARPRDLAFAAWFLTLYRLGVLRPSDVLERSTSGIVGKPESWLVEHATHWYERDVRSKIRGGVATHLEAHRSAGHVLVLLSSSTCYLGNPLGDELGVEHRLVNRLVVDEHGQFTGAFVQPLCYGRGKLAHARRFADDHRIDLAASYFYTDSVTDLSVLEQIGHPRVVDPDPRLAREARRRGWQVVSLDEPPAIRVDPRHANARRSRR